MVLVEFFFSLKLKISENTDPNLFTLQGSFIDVSGRLLTIIFASPRVNLLWVNKEETSFY